MPLIDVECPVHGKVETYQHVGAENRCPECGAASKRLWTAGPRTVVDFRDGWDPGAGKYFSTKSERESWIRESGSRRIKD
jgi:hypothetical protein